MDTTHYDWAIIGAGAAGMQLALAMIEEGVLTHKKLLIIDKDWNFKAARTWCFWEQGAGKYDALLTKTWYSGLFRPKGSEIKLDLGGYAYKMLKSQDFLPYAKNILQQHSQITLVEDSILKIEASDSEAVLQGTKGTYMALQVLDSGVAYDQLDKNDTTWLWQHFKGWVIATEQPMLHSEAFVMMDYNVPENGQTSFMYVLPLDAHHALVEYTYFSPQIASYDSYDAVIAAYIADKMNIDKYAIDEVEYGVIPMTDYNFSQHNTKRITKIGTGGGWVKASTGYSFARSGHYAQQMAANIRCNRPLKYGIGSKKYSFYDTLFLRVLHRYNAQGHALFTSMYQKNKAYAIFDFLSEATNFNEELKLMSSFKATPFMRALFNK